MGFPSPTEARSSGSALRWASRILLAGWTAGFGALSQAPITWMRIQHPVDKFLHVGSFAGFGFLLAMANTPRWRRHNLWLVPLSGLLGGAFSEALQTFAPGREVSLGDALADLFGTLVGLAAWWGAFHQGRERSAEDSSRLAPPWS